MSTNKEEYSRRSMHFTDAFEFKSTELSDLIKHLFEVLDKHNEFAWALSDLSFILYTKEIPDTERRLLIKAFEEVIQNMESTENYLKKVHKKLEAK